MRMRILFVLPVEERLSSDIESENEASGSDLVEDDQDTDENNNDPDTNEIDDIMEDRIENISPFVPIATYL